MQTTRWFLALTLVSALLVSPTAALANCNEGYGDINGDGSLTVVDVQCLILMSLWSLGPGDPTTSPTCLGDGKLHVADLNCDGVANITDTQIGISLAFGAPLNPLADADGDGCLDDCQTLVLGGAELLRATSYSGQSVGSGLVLVPLANGFETGDASSGSGTVLMPEPIGAKGIE